MPSWPTCSTCKLRTPSFNWRRRDGQSGAFPAISGWIERPSGATCGIRLIRTHLRRIQNHPPFRPPGRIAGRSQSHPPFRPPGMTLFPARLLPPWPPTRGQFLILIYKVSAETGSGISDGLKTDETYLCENRVRVGGKKTASDGCSDGSAGLAKKNEVGCCRTRSSNPRGTGPSAVK